MKVAWREWYSESAVAALTRCGTLPRYEVELEFRGSTGVDLAEAIAYDANSNDSSCFTEEGSRIVIIEPEEFAGVYDVDVDWSPSYSASRSKST